MMHWILKLEQALIQRRGRKKKLDPTKLEATEVTGEENVAVINRETGKRITGSKAPPLRYLKEWLLRNPGFDVDPKWAHIVQARVCTHSFPLSFLLSTVSYACLLFAGPLAG